MTTANANIEDRRTYHGGDDSALSIEVSAVRGFRTGSISTCNEVETMADGYAVYIRNPLAFHVQDFGPETVDETRRVSMIDAKAAAFTYADALAEHLGCPVVSVLDRPAPAPVEVSQTDLIEAAACLWEAALDYIASTRVDGPAVALRTLCEFEGAPSLRLRVIGWAEECHRAWLADGGYERDDSFDRDYCPDWLARKLDTL